MDVRWDGYQQFGQWRKHPKHAGPRQCAYRLGFDACGAPRLCVEQLAVLLEDWGRLGAEQRDPDRHVSQWHSRLRQRFQYPHGLAHNWTVKAEWAFIGLNSWNFSATPLAVGFVGDRFNAHRDINMFTVGANYKF